MTKTWEREFAVSRMREDPTISYRALAKVLDCSDSTIRQWRDEERIQPRPHHNTGQRRNGGRSVPWRGTPARPAVVPTPDHDDDDSEDDGDLPEADLLDEENEEEAFELDDAPADSRAASLVQTWETIGKLGGLWLGLKPSTSPGAHRRRIAASTGIRSPTPEDPRTRLGAITAELDYGSPRGTATKLLVEAAPYLTGGVTALRQYGEARGCHPSEVAAAERAVIGKEER